MQSNSVPEFDCRLDEGVERRLSVAEFDCRLDDTLEGSSVDSDVSFD